MIVSEFQQRGKFASTNADDVAGLHRSTSNHHLPNLVPSFDWSGWDYEPTNVAGDIDGLDQFQPASSYSVPGGFHASTNPAGQQHVDAPDIWQAPVNFEWDQWAAFAARFPGERLDLNVD
jgi:hypothetical protein